MLGFGRPQVSAEPGMNRMTWNLRYKGPTTVKKSVTFGGNLNEGPLVLPGNYTVKLSVDGKDYTKKHRKHVERQLHFFLQVSALQNREEHDTWR